MDYLKISFMATLVLIASLVMPNVSFADTYPKNTKIDALNYIFEIELSDDTDEIICKATVDVRSDPKTIILNPKKWFYIDGIYRCLVR